MAACAVNEDIDAAVVGDAIADCGAALISVGNIVLAGGDGAVGFFYYVGGCCEAGWVAANAEDLSAFGGDALGDAGANAGGCAGDQGDFVFESAHKGLLSIGLVWGAFGVV